MIDPANAPPTINRLIQLIDHTTLWVGRTIAWLTLIMVIATCIVVFMRRGLDLGSIALQESITYMHAVIFLLGAAYALKRDGQVRVDIFYRQFSPVKKAWVNSLGTLLFLIPTCGFIGFISIDFVVSSWQIREGSTDSGGLDYVYLLKSLILVMAFTMILQGIAELLRSALVLAGYQTPTKPAEDIR